MIKIHILAFTLKKKDHEPTNGPFKSFVDKATDEQIENLYTWRSAHPSMVPPIKPKGVSQIKDKMFRKLMQYILLLIAYDS